MSNVRLVWVELACTVLIPTVVLMFGPDWLGPTGALIVALLFPFGFAIGSMVKEGRPSTLSVVALTSVVLTGGLGLLALDPKWFAVKEALVPMVLGLAFAGSAWTRFAVVRVALDRILDPERTRAALDATGGHPAFERAIHRATIESGLVLVASAPLSFALAAWLVRAPSGTVAFARELGRYNLVSFPLVSVPVLLASGWVMWRAWTAIEAAAGVPPEDLLIAELR